MEKKDSTVKNKKTVKKINTNKSKSSNNKKATKQLTKQSKKVEQLKEKEQIITKKQNLRPKEEISGNFGGEEIRKLLIIIGAVCAIMLAFYFITEVVLKNKSDKKNDNEIKVEPIIQYEQILMGSMFNQSSKEYYVFAYTEDDNLLDIYNQYISNYTKLDDSLNVYKVNLSEDFNKSYIGEESYLSGNDLSKIKVTGTTLIRIKNNKIIYSYEGYEEIKDKFNALMD